MFKLEFQPVFWKCYKQIAGKDNVLKKKIYKTLQKHSFGGMGSGLLDPKSAILILFAWLVFGIRGGPPLILGIRVGPPNTTLILGPP